MKHRIRNYFLVLSLSVYGLGFSQTITLEPGSFPWYDDILSKTYNINCKLPVNFTDIKSKYIEIYKDDNNWKASYAYFPVIQSNDKECVLMYNMLPSYGFLTKNLVIGEIAGTLGLDSCVPAQRDTINLENHVTITTGKSVHDSFNADSIITYEIPRRTAYLNKYKYCISMMIVKKERATMILKWFFTENGLKNKDRYFNLLNNCITYKNGEWNYDKKQIPSAYELALSQMLQVVKFKKEYMESK